jgi:hypothetical protein
LRAIWPGEIPAGWATAGSQHLAGAEGFEPPKAVLETAGLPLAYAPNYPTLIAYQNLFGLTMRLMLPAIGAEFLEFQTLRGGLLILRIAVVPVLAFLALELNDLARHTASFFSFKSLKNRVALAVSRAPGKI